MLSGPGRPHIPWSNYAHAPRLLSLCSGAWELQLPKPKHPTACAPQQVGPLQWEARAPQLERGPAHHNWRKALTAAKTQPAQQLIMIIIN